MQLGFIKNMQRKKPHENRPKCHTAMATINYSVGNLVVKRWRNCSRQKLVTEEGGVGVDRGEREGG
jgi:hypothetical protein